MRYAEFLAQKSQPDHYGGFDPLWIPDFLFDFQKLLVDWAIRKGKAAIFADCGLGKTPIQLTWAENVVRHTNRPVLIVTPLAVRHQVIVEAEKFGVEAIISGDGTLKPGARVVVANYERLHLFDPTAFAGVVCDESSILKNFDGKRRAIVTEFLRTLSYRLLCTATAAPNDYIELGTSSEALGEMGYLDMLTRFFKNEQNTIKPTIYHRGKRFEQLDERAKWRFKGHAEAAFWRWVSSWARAMRKPSDYGFEDGSFELPALEEHEHVVASRRTRDGMLFDLPATGLHEEREERRRTIPERCERVAELVDPSTQCLVWCHLNAEADLLETLIPGARQVSGADSDDAKEEKLIAFASGELRVLVTKPKIGAWGLNLQRCARITFFPSHSYEQYYQGVRRCWRFGQKRSVRVDIVATEGERNITKNLRRKAAQADRMFTALIEHMSEAVGIRRTDPFETTEEIPTWLSPIKS